MPIQVRFGGLGGQGIVLAGTMLGEAAALAGLHAAGSNSYGAAARGTTCRSDVVVSDDRIDYPHLRRPDVLAVMSQAAYDAFAPSVADGGAILFDEFTVKPGAARGAHHAVPATSTALREFGSRQAANIVMLGAMLAVTRVAPVDAVREAVRRHSRERFVETNLRALEAGLALGGRRGAAWPHVCRDPRTCD